MLTGDFSSWNLTMSKFEVPTQYMMHRKCSNKDYLNSFSHHYDYVDVSVGNEIG